MKPCADHMLLGRGGTFEFIASLKYTKTYKSDYACLHLPNCLINRNLFSNTKILR